MRPPAAELSPENGSFSRRPHDFHSSFGGLVGGGVIDVVVVIVLVVEGVVGVVAVVLTVVAVEVELAVVVVRLVVVRAVGLVDWGLAAIGVTVGNEGAIDDVCEGKEAVSSVEIVENVALGSPSGHSPW